MTQNQKASFYGKLLDEHTRLHNRISELKNHKINPTREDLFEIKKLENNQLEIMSAIRKLF
jgi:hypothetical protein